MAPVKRASTPGPASVTQWNLQSMACFLTVGGKNQSGNESMKCLLMVLNMSTGPTSIISVSLICKSIIDTCI